MRFWLYGLGYFFYVIKNSFESNLQKWFSVNFCELFRGGFFLIFLFSRFCNNSKLFVWQKFSWLLENRLWDLVIIICISSKKKKKNRIFYKLFFLPMEYSWRYYYLVGAASVIVGPTVWRDGESKKLILSFLPCRRSLTLLNMLTANNFHI